MSNTQETTQTAAPAELSVVDLQNIRSIIDAAAQRGAFRANEMQAIGGVYNKLDAFINAVAPQEPAEAQEPADKE